MPVARYSRVLLILVVPLVGCGWISATPQGVADQYFDLIRSGKLAQAATLVHKKDEAEVSWETELADVRDRLGTLEHYELRDQTRGVTPERDGELLSLVYEVTYSKHATYEELLITTRAGDPRPQIVAHDIRSPWLSDLLALGEDLTDQYLAAVDDERFMDIANLYAPRLRGTTRRELIRGLRARHEERGEVLDYTLVEAEKHPGRALERDLVLVYEVRYATQTLRERFWIKRTLTDEIGIADVWSQ